MSNQNVDIQEWVRLFHETFGHPINHAPTLDIPTRDLHRDVMREEYIETEEAYENNDLVEFADGLGDLVWTAIARSIAHGIDLNAVLQRIALSNMSKLGEDGNPIYREDGKILKGPNYFPPGLDEEIAHQQQTGTFTG